jgi:hypothetical protein
MKRLVVHDSPYFNRSLRLLGVKRALIATVSEGYT